MNARSLLPAAALAAVLSGCATVAPKDYTEFRQSSPHSILVLPPLNESTDVLASYSVLTAMVHPLGEMGYYVFPVELVDQCLKENGLTVPGEMHQAPLKKLQEVFGADAVLYLTVEQYGSKYQVVSRSTQVHVRGRLVDARTGVVIWEGFVHLDNGGPGGVGSIEGVLANALVGQILSKTFDEAHATAMMAAAQLVSSSQGGLLRGPRHPEQFGATAP